MSRERNMTRGFGVWSKRSDNVGFTRHHTGKSKIHKLGRGTRARRGY